MSVQSFGPGHGRSSSLSTLAETTANSSLSHLPTTLDKLKKVDLYQNLGEYEEALSMLTDSVDKYKPDINLARGLIRADYKLNNSLDAIAEYDQINSVLQRLDKESERIREQTGNILRILNECHHDLDILPSLEQVEFEMNSILSQRQKINSKTLLDYATKLSKFTKIPPTFDRGAIGPNNFVWPGDDALRRGMLAMASLHADELTRIPGESTEENILKSGEDKSQAEGIAGASADIEFGARSPSYADAGSHTYMFSGEGNTHEHKEQKEKEEEDIDLDLDLFNPDEL